MSTTKTPKKRDIVNRTGGVVTDDGRTLYGFDAEIFVKLKGKEDPEWQKKVALWLEEVVGLPLEDPNDLWVSLKDGIFLIKLLLKIKPGIIKKYTDQKKNGKVHPLMERENITLYLEQCYKLGVPSIAMFVINDLHKRANIQQVLNNLKALSEIAVRHNPSIPPIPERHIKESKPVDGRKIWEIEAEAMPMGTDEEDELDKLDKQIKDIQKKITDIQSKIRSAAGKMQREKNLFGREEQKVKETLAELEKERAKGKGENNPLVDATLKAIFDLREEKDILNDQLNFPDADSEEAKIQRAIEAQKEQMAAIETV
eukprot:TRINITY_DN554_c0_g1_i8.p1 TRINITY_DN554_c0_g1~~TRINITY_DN554_c0_g1_i8.p1  ORF type:complete len:313 (-),score=91.30 TRINITY_DN554_c0_g1_i8:102-1040(-)